jgi:vitamin B12 transporter
MKLKKTRNYLTFRQWTRDSFAVMNSLHKVIKVATMCVTYSMLTQPGKTYAQADSTQVIQKLQEVVVSAQRAPVTYSNVARVVHVIPRSEIANAPVLSLNELLDYTPGVDIRQRGTNGIQADVSIQGGSFDQSLILLNGINISDPQTGHLSMNLPIDLESVSRVEVLTGSASRVFGANAFTGAINILTNPTEKSFVRASVTGGDFGLYKVGFTSQYNINSFYSHLSYSTSSSNGYTHNTDYNTQSLFYQGGMKKDNYQINLQAGSNAKDYGANSFYSLKYLNQFEANKTYFAGINGSFGKTFVIKPTVYWKRNYDHYILIRQNPAAYQNFHFTDVYGTNLNSELKWAAGTTTLGLEYRNETIYSTRLGELTPDSIKVKGQENAYYNHSSSRYNYSIFLEHSFDIKEFSASGGLMINHHSKLDKDFVLYPGVDLAYKLNLSVKIYGTFNKSLRLPTFTDLYYSSPENISNTSLKPEEAEHYEAGFKYANKGISGNISWFYRNGTNIIDLVEVSQGIYQFQNIPHIDCKGLEVTASFSIPELINQDILIKKVSISYNYFDLERNSGAHNSRYALDNLKQKFSSSLNHNIYKNLSAVWYLNYQERNGGYGKYYAATETEPARTVQTSYEPYWLLDGRLNWKPGMFNVFVEVTNIFNNDYFDFGSVPQPGRWAKIGISFELGL